VVSVGIIPACKRKSPCAESNRGRVFLPKQRGRKTRSDQQDPKADNHFAPRQHNTRLSSDSLSADDDPPGSCTKKEITHSRKNCRIEAVQDRMCGNKMYVFLSFFFEGPQGGMASHNGQAPTGHTQTQRHKQRCRLVSVQGLYH